MGTFIAIIAVTAFNLAYGWFCYHLGTMQQKADWRSKFEDAAVDARIYEKRCKAAQDRIEILEREIRAIK